LIFLNSGDRECIPKGGFPGRFPRTHLQAVTGGGIMIDDIFIKYANSSLRDNPGILLDLYREFAESGYVRFITKYWKVMHEMTFEWHDKFAKFDNYPDAYEAYNYIDAFALNH
jgi:hypothetical protein